MPRMTRQGRRHPRRVMRGDVQLHRLADELGVPARIIDEVLCEEAPAILAKLRK